MIPKIKSFTNSLRVPVHVRIPDAKAIGGLLKPTMGSGVSRLMSVAIEDSRHGVRRRKINRGLGLDIGQRSDVRPLLAGEPSVAGPVELNMSGYDSGARIFRRGTLPKEAATGAVAVMAGHAPATAFTTIKLGKSPVTQVALPYADDALAPVISASTIGVHYGKHHKAYVDATAKAIMGTPLANASLEEIILATASDPALTGLFNSAAQALNHNFYWQSLSPEQQTPSGKLKYAIDRDFGGTHELKAALCAGCVGQFGSGWGWLVLDGGHLKVAATGNAGNPMLSNQTPLLTIDVWEHAYYLDHQNRRSDYATALVEAKLNWEFAALNFAAAQST